MTRSSVEMNTANAASSPGVFDRPESVNSQKNADGLSCCQLRAQVGLARCGGHSCCELLFDFGKRRCKTGALLSREEPRTVAKRQTGSHLEEAHPVQPRPWDRLVGGCHWFHSEAKAGLLRFVRALWVPASRHSSTAPLRMK